MGTHNVNDGFTFNKVRYWDQEQEREFITNNSLS